MVPPIGADIGSWWSRSRRRSPMWRWSPRSTPARCRARRGRRSRRSSRGRWCRRGRSRRSPRRTRAGRGRRTGSNGRRRIAAPTNPLNVPPPYPAPRALPRAPIASETAVLPCRLPRTPRRDRRSGSPRPSRMRRRRPGWRRRRCFDPLGPANDRAGVGRGRAAQIEAGAAGVVVDPADPEFAPATRPLLVKLPPVSRTPAPPPKSLLPPPPRMEPVLPTVPPDCSRAVPPTPPSMTTPPSAPSGPPCRRRRLPGRY